jgi:hypothetical protein
VEVEKSTVSPWTAAVKKMYAALEAFESAFEVNPKLRASLQSLKSWTMSSWPFEAAKRVWVKGGYWESGIGVEVRIEVGLRVLGCIRLKRRGLRFVVKIDISKDLRRVKG